MGEGQMPAENIADKTLSDTAQDSAGDHVDNKEDALQSAADNDAEAEPVKPAGKKKKNTPWKAARKKIRKSLSKASSGI